MRSLLNRVSDLDANNRWVIDKLMDLTEEVVFESYDSAEFRRELRRRGIRPSVPQRHWPGHKRTGRPPKVYPVSTCRWKVERTHGWLDNWRRLVVRYDRHTDVYIAFLTIACFMTTLSEILGWVHDSRFLRPNAFSRRAF